MRSAVVALAALTIGSLSLATPAGAELVDHTGASIAGTSTSGRAAQLVAGPTVVQPLASPNTPGDDDPAVLAGLGSPTDPEDDLEAALIAMAGATTTETADAARTRALAILRGDPIDGAAYSGIPLLNWNAPSKVRNVPPGGTVTVRIARFEGQTISDTSLLRFEDPALPFRIAYEVSALSHAEQDELAPTPLLADAGGPIGGLHSTLVDVGISPFATGTRTTSRFTDGRGMSGGAEEMTRVATQRFTVQMPAPRYVEAILEPTLRSHAGAAETVSVASLGVLREATDARLDAAAGRTGYRGSSPTPAERDAAIQRIGVRAPERQLHDELAALDPASGDFLPAAQALGEQDRSLVSAMRSRDALPPGFAGDAAADANIVLLNGEGYRSTDVVRPSADGTVKVSVTNGDEVARSLDVAGLHDRDAVHGALDWGTFKWGEVGGLGDTTLAPGASRTLTIPAGAKTFALVLADADGGDSASVTLRVDHDPVRESRAIGPAFAEALHAAEDADGAMWVSLSGIDSIARVRAPGKLGDAEVDRFLIPGGNHDGSATPPPLAPQDVEIDGSGIVWVTLPAGNAIARLDPARVHPGTTDGIRVYNLADCGEHDCRVPFPPEIPAPPPTRGPLQLGVMNDADGNSVLFFTQMNADRIGGLRIAPNGDVLDQVDYPCGCTSPLGLGLGPDGSVWFTEAVDNRIGRLRLDTTRPYAASTVSVDHFKIPSGVLGVDPALSPNPIFTSAPHSLALAPDGRVWFSEAATSKLGVLDPAAAHPGTTDGMTETELTNDPFGRAPVPADVAVDRAGEVFWTDEYGDVVGTLAPDGKQRSLRPRDRNSLTDSPVVDSRGDLWFLEAGSSVMTRISSVSAGADRPHAAPVMTARTADGSLSATGLQGVGSVDVTVRRNGTVVSRVAGVPVDGGAFAVGPGGRAWDTQGRPALRGNDVVSVTIDGGSPRAPLTFTVAALDATERAGAVDGRATMGGAPLAGSVSIQLDGASQAARAGIDRDAGTFSIGIPAGASGAGTVTWAGASPSVVARTVTTIAALPVPPRAGDATGGGDAPAASATDPAAVTPAPGPPPVTASPESRRGACSAWLVRGTGGPRVALLGASQARVLACLGSPSTRSSGATGRWSYGRDAELRFVRGRLSSIVVLRGAFATAPRTLRIGSSVGAARRALGPLASAGARSLRAVLAQGSGSVADVRLGLSAGRRPHVTRITVTLRRAAALDAAGRRLLRSGR